MSPKLSSLAYDEVNVQNHESLNDEMSFEPELNLLINTRLVGSSSAKQVTQIAGSITVSF